MFNDFFYFPKSDRRAIILLAITAVCCIAVDSHRCSKNGKGEDIHVEEEIQTVKQTDVVVSNKEKTISLHSFDPNTVDSATLVSFGLRPVQARTLQNYRKAGGKFRTPESISKLYGWSQEDVDRLLPYVHIGEGFRASNPIKQRNVDIPTIKHENKDTVIVRSKFMSDKFQTTTIIDPNTADSTTLRRIPGIGTHISRSIIRYRERLGGFHHIEQLLEIKIFSPELLEWFEISSPDINTININEASFQKLNSHPYISYDQTRALLKYIRLYGNIRNIEQLSTTNIFTEEEIEKLTPYITF